MFLLEFSAQTSGPQSKDNHCQGAVGQRGFGKTIPRAEHIFIGFAELSAGCGVHAVISKGQGKQRSFTDCGIKFSADEEVCGCQGIAKVPLFTVGQSHQSHET